MAVPHSRKKAIMKIAHTKLYADIKSKGFSKEQMREIRKQLIIAYKAYDRNQEYAWNFEEHLNTAFIWKYTPQGFSYWHFICWGEFYQGKRLLNVFFGR